MEDIFKDLRLKIEEINTLIENAREDYETLTGKTRARTILNSTNLFNFHIQDNVECMPLKDALKLCEELEVELKDDNDGNDVVLLKIATDLSCGIYQVDGIDYKIDRLLFRINKVEV